MTEISWEDISVSDMDYILIDHAGFIDGDKRCVYILDDYIWDLNMKGKEK